MLLLLNKPEGITSFDCIRSLKKIYHRSDMGHGGTLDKFATGVLPIFMGEGLKLARFFLESYPQLSVYWKLYEGTIQLGTATATGDPEGTVTATEEVPTTISYEHIQNIFSEFIQGPYMQTPPIYSAKKIAGTRASDLARKAEGQQDFTLELKAVPVQIRNLECVDTSETVLEQIKTKKQLKFRVLCSKGTYARVLAQDIAHKLGTVGHLVTLTRTAVGPFTLAQTHSLEDAQRTPLPILLSLAQTLDFLDTIPMSSGEAFHVYRGNMQWLTRKAAQLQPGIYCARDEQKIPLALVEGGRFSKVLRVFNKEQITLDNVRN